MRIVNILMEDCFVKPNASSGSSENGKPNRFTVRREKCPICAKEILIIRGTVNGSVELRCHYCNKRVRVIPK